MSLLIFLFALLLRLIVQYYLGAFIAPQTWEYETVANNFLSGAGLSYEIYGTTYFSLVSPLYPLLCAFVYSLSNHSFFLMVIIQAIFSSFICVVIYWIGSHIFGNKAGILAAILVIFHPGILVYTAKLHSFVLDTLFFSLIVWLLLKTKIVPNLVNQLKLGFVFGLAMLSRSTIILFLPISWLCLKKGSKNLFIVYILTALFIFSPWIIRNYIIYKKLVVLSSSANVFWRGNNPLATGTSLAPSGKPILEESKDMVSLIYGKDEMQQNKIFWNKSFEFIKDNPDRFLSLTLRKFFYFWWFAPTTGSQYQKAWLDIYKIYYCTIITFAILGIFALKKVTDRLRYDAFIIITFILVISFTQSLFYVETRHRWAIEPLLLVFAASGIIEAGRIIVKCLRKKT